MTWQALVESTAAAKLTTTQLKRMRRRSLPKSFTADMLQLLFDRIAFNVMHGKRVAIPNFGVFYPSRRKARTVRNPATKELMQLPETQGIGFRVSKNVKR